MNETIIQKENVHKVEIESVITTVWKTLTAFPSFFAMIIVIMEIVLYMKIEANMQMLAVRNASLRFSSGTSLVNFCIRSTPAK